MNKFETKSVYASDILLDNNVVSRILNIQVQMNYEPCQNLLTNGPTQEEIAKQLGDAIVNVVAKKNIVTPTLDGKKLKTPLSQEEAKENEFGWRELVNN
jgi:hypothetical protein